MSNVVVIVVLSVALLFLAAGVVAYWMRHKLRHFCQKIFHRKKRVHEITAPVRPSGENEIVLAVTHSSRPMGSSSARVVRHSSNVTELTRTRSRAGNYDVRPYRPPPPYHRTVSRHQSFPSQPRPRFVGASDYPSPLVSNLSSLQSLLMSSQVAVFNSSTERLSLSSQNQVPLQSISSAQYQQQLESSSTVPSPLLTLSPVVRSSMSVHLAQPSYFDELPPSYQQSMLIRKLRASSRSSKAAAATKTNNTATVTPTQYGGGGSTSANIATLSASSQFATQTGSPRGLTEL